MRKIIHIDMDCFYAAVEEKYRPEFKGKPLGIGGPPQTRSVLCTANYEARKFGVKSAMSSAHALRLCPSLILVPPQFYLYKKESQSVREIFERFTSKIEPLSLDEAYLDVTDCEAFGGSATLIAQEIRRLIYLETQLTASAGVAPNKFLAKVASDWNKPNGQFVVTPQRVDLFVKSLPVEKIYGVGKVTAEKFHRLGILTCQDLQSWSMSSLQANFGSRALDYYEYARGIDNREVKTNRARKSLSVEETFLKDTDSLKALEKSIDSLYLDFLNRLNAKSEYRDKIAGWVVKVKYSDFKQSTHEEVHRSLPQAEDFHRLLRVLFERRSDAVRLVGIGVRLKSSETEAEDLSQLQFAM